MFERTCDENLRICRDAVQSGNANALREAAHSIKGVAAGLGASNLSASAAELERCAGQAQLDLCGHLLDSVETRLATAVQQLRQWVALD
jgi:HPt (histidine-containing phosphotransfer) domain-containing protein